MLNISVKRLWDQLVTLWPQVNLPMLNRPSFLLLRGVRQASPSNPHADQASPRTSTQWLSRETYCMASAFSKVSLPLLDLIYWLICSLLCPDLSLNIFVWLTELAWSVCLYMCVGGTYCTWLSSTPKEGQNTLCCGCAPWAQTCIYFIQIDPVVMQLGLKHSAMLKQCDSSWIGHSAHEL